MNYRVKDITGTIYHGTMTALRYSHTSPGGAHWVFQCICGKETTTAAHSVKSGDAKSCGCLRVANSATIRLKHGLSGTRLYHIWAGMNHRCTSPKNRGYRYYGGRGISVCEEWAGDFEKFYNWALANGYQTHLTIDRENNDGNYEPGNCRWVTMTVQANNKRPRTNRLKK